MDTYPDLIALLKQVEDMNKLAAQIKADLQNAVDAGKQSVTSRKNDNARRDGTAIKGRETKEQ